MATEVGVAVVIHGDLNKFERDTQLNIQNAIKAMADATVQRAQMLRDGNGVPVSSGGGTLQATGVVEPRGEYTQVAQFGAGLTYGRYQEFGPDGDKYTGKKTQWNYTTPGTGPHYLKTAGDSVAKEGIKKYL